MCASPGASSFDAKRSVVLPFSLFASAKGSVPVTVHEPKAIACGPGFASSEFTQNSARSHGGLSRIAEMNKHDVHRG